MSLLAIDRNPGQAKLRRFATTWLPAFLVLGGLGVFHDSGDIIVPLILWGGGLLSTVVGMLAPGRMKPVYLALTVITFPVGWLFSFVLLLFIFFLVITPVGVVLRVLGRNTMSRSFDRDADSYWTPRKPSDDADRVFRQF